MTGENETLETLIGERLADAIGKKKIHQVELARFMDESGAAWVPDWHVSADVPGHSVNSRRALERYGRARVPGLNAPAVGLAGRLA